MLGMNQVFQNYLKYLDMIVSLGVFLIYSEQLYHSVLVKQDGTIFLLSA